MDPRLVICEACGAQERASRGPVPTRRHCRPCQQRRANECTAERLAYQTARRDRHRALRACASCHQQPPRKGGKYCSEKCLRSATNARLRTSILRSASCAGCGEAYETDRLNQTYCTPACRDRADARIWKPTRRLYRTGRWLRLRQAQLESQPHCSACGAPAKVADHVTPHRGDEEAFWSSPLQSLCKPCHDGPKQRTERGGVSETLGSSS